MARYNNDSGSVYKDFEVASKNNELLLRYLVYKYSELNRLDISFIRDKHGMILYLSKCYADWAGRINKRRGLKPKVDDFVHRYSRGFDNLSYIVGDELSFISKNEQKCFIFWYCIRVQHLGKNYESMGLPDTPKDHQEMYAVVQHYMLCVDFELEFKINMLRSIRKVCSDYDEVKGGRKEPFNWIDDKNEYFISWAWNYAKGEILRRWVGAVEHSRKKLLLTAAFFVWNAHRDTKRIFLKDMRSAWSQKKFRDKNEANSRINTYVSNEVKSALDELVLMEGTSIRSVLERLVLDESERRKDKVL